MEILHLMVNNTCNNNCPLCCNKQYDVDEIPVVTVKELQKVKTICITGGEPFISYDIYDFLRGLFKQYKNIEECFIYTSGGELDGEAFQLVTLQELFNVKIGLSIGPKSKFDRIVLRQRNIIPRIINKLYTNRLYCFNDLDRSLIDIYSNLNIEIIDRKWQEKFVPAPNTIFRRLPIWI